MPHVDLIVLARDERPLHPEVERGIRQQQDVRLAVHRVIGKRLPADRCRWDAIVRARNEGKLRGSAPWLMFLDDDVVLAPACISQLVDELGRRPVYGALGADYLGQNRPGRVAQHVSMGATIFRREAIDQIYFAWREKRCECQCCCDDLRQLCWGIDYYAPAKARHLPKSKVSGSKHALSATHCEVIEGAVNDRRRPASLAIPSVCLVACYLGPLPGWIEQYLLSCAYNPSINFLIFTDQPCFPVTPPNVSVEPFSKEAFNERATKTFGVEIKLSHPHKLCDFKPTYGHLFEEYLRGFDYWGYTDLDVIYGDIRRFLSIARLQAYDVFTARKEFLVGHFSLFRNDFQMRTLYQQSANYRVTLQSPVMHSFSECGKQWVQRLQGKPLTNRAACDSMTHIVFRQAAASKISACFSPFVIERPELAHRRWRLRWHAGRLWSIDRRREAMYFHFNAFRRRPGFREPNVTEGDTAFEITRDGLERVSPIVPWN